MLSNSRKCYENSGSLRNHKMTSSQVSGGTLHRYSQTMLDFRPTKFLIVSLASSNGTKFRSHLGVFPRRQSLTANASGFSWNQGAAFWKPGEEFLFESEWIRSPTSFAASLGSDMDYWGPKYKKVPI